MQLLLIFNELPHIITLGLGAVVLVLYGAFFSKSQSSTFYSDGLKLLTLVGLLASTTLIFQNIGMFKPNRTVSESMIYADMFSFFSSLLILICAILNIPLLNKTLENIRVQSKSEFLAIYLFAVLGALVFATSANLLMLFIGLEIMSLSTYCLCASVIERRESTESGVKYFILGSVASAFVLYAISLIYGATGSLSLVEISKLIKTTEMVANNLFLIKLSMIFFTIGLFFKVGAVPLHFWIAEVYKGAPLSITSLMSSVIKCATVIVIFRIFLTVFPQSSAFNNVELNNTVGFSAVDWKSLISFIAGASMIIGSLLALTEGNLKKMLAFSGIAQIGYMLVAFVSSTPLQGGATALFFYLIIYSLVSIGIFSALNAFAKDDRKLGSNCYQINELRGLGKKRPFLAGMLSLLLLTLAGLPPGIGGLTGKLLIFGSALRADHYLLVYIALFSIIISAYYYLKVIAVMYFGVNDLQINSNNFNELESEKLVFKHNSNESTFSLKGVSFVCCVLVLYIGIQPNTLYEILGMILFSLG